MIDGVPHVICQGCERAVPALSQPNHALPDEGITITLSGWYGGFTDDFPEPPTKLTVCHDCALGVFRAIPALASRRGLHSTRSDEACCEFHWTIRRDEEGKSIVHGDGTEVKLTKDGRYPRITTEGER
jgi:hypothetical protein